jgi:hypothetical protein
LRYEVSKYLYEYLIRKFVEKLTAAAGDWLEIRAERHPKKETDAS